VPGPGRTAVALAAFLAITLTTSACHTETLQEQRASLCTDLGSLRATFAFLRDPPPAARVGEVRGDLDKLDPTITRTLGSDVADAALAQQLSDAQEAYRTLLHGIGDDDRFSTLPAGGEGEDLWGAYASLAEQLGCGASLVAGG
jgi:hypothetical protein